MSWLPLIVGLVLGMALCGKPSATALPVGTGLWLILAMGLEIASPRLPRFGFVSAASGLWLALVLRDPSHAWLPVLASGVALVCRLGRSVQPSGWGLTELLSDWQPVCLACGLAHASGQGVFAPPLWLVLWWLQPSFVIPLLPEEIASEWSLYRARLGAVALGSAALAFPTAGAPPMLAVLSAVALFCLSSTSRQLVRGADADVQAGSQRRRERGLQQRQQGLDRIEEGLRETDRAQRRTQAELEVRLETYQLMDEMLESIPRRPVFQAVAQLIVERLQQRFRVTNALLFWQGEQGFVPVAAQTPYPDRIAAAQLTQASEPVVEQALRTRRLEQMAQPAAAENRLFPEDLWSVAVPMQDRGALYLGHTSGRNLSEEDAHFLLVLARHAVLALDAAAWYQTLQSSLQREAATAARNEALVQRLALVIDGVTELIRLREPRAMLESAGRILAPVVAHDGFYARTGDLEIHMGAGSAPELQTLAQKVTDQGLPLLLNSPARLAVPLLSERGVLGGLVLLRQNGAEFERADQDILSVLSYQLGSALVSAQLFAELQKTHQALRDSQAQLVQSSKMAAVGQLAGGVAHELNTPLGAIALAIEAAQMNLETKPEKAGQRLQRASKAVGQMKEIVSKLLFYSRDARSGWRETHLNQVIDDTLQLVGHQLRLDNIEVVQQPGELPPMLANANELQQVFTNLILNARDAMLSPGAAGKRLLLSTGTTPDGRLWARVQDQGCGMTAEVAERIFEPFFTTKDVGKGTGLGLSVTSQLIAQHGGSITVKSFVGQGTQFEMVLPLQPPPDAA